MKSAIRVLLPAWLALLAWGGPAALAGEADPLSARLQAGDPEAVAILEQQFAEAQEAEEKKTIATRLAATGSASELIVAYLEGHGWEAVRSSRPYPFAFDSDGNLIEPVIYSEEFIAWVEAFAGDLEREARIAAREQPADVVRLEHLEGPRIDAVLLAGIHSPNHAVKVASAKAIARHGHSDAVPSIVAAASCMAVNEKGRTLSAPADLKVVPPAP